MESKTAHVVYDAIINGFRCINCGETYKPNLPATFDMFLAMSKAFSKSHKNCKDKK